MTPHLSQRGGGARSLARSLAFHTCRVPLPTSHLSPTLELVLFVFSFGPFCIFLDFEAVCIFR